ncbi:MAG TPA: methylene-tetrahydromethanopterin dehydrogenase N-terminal domain-containing protein [Alphaproteobacteria bacterium]|nr:methylene-tetrahydromethanopterin dehydrogenase N-terminal domain-containing protein [Alphaproteobacteria bacterium]
MTKPRILHFVTPLANVSPFDVNMAADAGFTIASYTHVGLNEVTALTQDAMFSRPPPDAPKTCLFIGGRDAALALDMMAAAKAAMFPPFQISVFADPSGAFTTAGAMVACVERHLKAIGASISGARVGVLGAKGVVGGITGVIAAEAGADVVLIAHDKSGIVERKVAEFETRFKRRFVAADGSTDAAKRKAIGDCVAIFSAGRAGVRTLSHADLVHANRLLVVADINAVPPLGVEGVDVMADGAEIVGTKSVGIGAFAIGNIKFKTQHELLKRIHDAAKAQYFDYRDAYQVAREIAS